jgi:hypothetical protein
MTVTSYEFPGAQTCKGIQPNIETKRVGHLNLKAAQLAYTDRCIDYFQVDGDEANQK